MTGMALLRVLLAGAAFAAAVGTGACSSDLDTPGTAAPGSDSGSPSSTPCSTGPAYGESNFPPPGAGSSEETLPECVPRCGAEQKFVGASFGPVFSVAALPSGACSNDGERCRMGAGTTASCPGEDTRACNLSAFECDCAGGAWRCVVTAAGAGVCGRCPVDASAPDGGR